jgi:hypothetical protein
VYVQWGLANVSTVCASEADGSTRWRWLWLWLIADRFRAGRLCSIGASGRAAGRRCRCRNGLCSRASASPVPLSLSLLPSTLTDSHVLSLSRRCMNACADFVGSQMPPKPKRSRQKESNASADDASRSAAKRRLRSAGPVADGADGDGDTEMTAAAAADAEMKSSAVASAASASSATATEKGRRTAARPSTRSSRPSESKKTKPSAAAVGPAPAPASVPVMFSDVSTVAQLFCLDTVASVVVSYAEPQALTRLHALGLPPMHIAAELDRRAADLAAHHAADLKLIGVPTAALHTNPQWTVVLHHTACLHDCSTAGRQVCVRPDQRGSCHDCHGPLCPQCSLRCAFCYRDFCDRHSRECGVCSLLSVTAVARSTTAMGVESGIVVRVKSTDAMRTDEC